MSSLDSLYDCKTSQDFHNFLDNFKWKEEHKTSEFVDLLVLKGNEFIQDAHGVEKFVVIFVSSRGFTAEVAVMLVKQTVYELLVRRCFKHASTGKSVEFLGFAIGNITDTNPDGRRLFSTSETASCLLNALNKHGTTASSVQCLAFAIGNITDTNPDGRRLFSTSETASSLLNALNKYATTPRSVQCLAFAIGKITDANPEAQRLFSTSETASSLLNALNKHGTTASSVQCLAFAIGKITDANPEARRLFSTSEMASAIIGSFMYATDESMSDLCLCLESILTSNEEGAKAPNFIEEFKKLEKYAASEKVKKQFNNCLLLLASAPPPAPTQQNGSASSSLQAEQQLVSLSHAPPPEGCFLRGVPKDLSFTDSVAACLSIRELPSKVMDDGPTKILRPDLEDYIPTDSDVTRLVRAIDRQLPYVLDRQVVKDLIKSRNLADDDIRALILYKLEEPYPFYRWMNAWLMGNRRDDFVKKSIGPIFTRIYRAMEKLPKVKCHASRSVKVDQIPALRETFDNFKTRCASGKLMSFWGMASFSRETGVGGHKFAGMLSDEAITYACENLEGVDTEPFKPEGMDNEHEILPLCPAVFEVLGATKVMSTKLVVQMKQLKHEDFAYVDPK